MCPKHSSFCALLTVSGSNGNIMWACLMCVGMYCVCCVCVCVCVCVNDWQGAHLCALYYLEVCVVGP